ncbi:EAL domain-containing protein [Pseudoalteromonas agarivorans]|uniref:EAL domain-containing protein n=1 Tax=Pseudoalteromonas agarivorans TaxID=176102 RepID=UPI002118E98B|nr:EAL domain-containing protein [Pseudoalteromonas agarivorans]MCQ8822309.1 EAL domain-containing protein [Pseudoalteromonas agarivorans]
MTVMRPSRIIEPYKSKHIDLRLAGHFNYFYQPQFALGSNKLKGFECLLRLSHPETGIVEPGRFIDRLNKSTIWNRLWPVMLNKVSVEQKRHGKALKLAINVSPNELEKGEKSIFLQCFYNMAKGGQLDATSIEIEITEDFQIKDYEQVNCSIYMLKQLGAKVVVDDFGAGFCNMVAIDKLNIDGVKIDRSLINGIDTSEMKQTIVKSLVSIANVKGCYVLAEGIETDSQRQMSEQLGCKYGQGFLLGRPSPSFVHLIQF